MHFLGGQSSIIWRVIYIISISRTFHIRLYVIDRSSTVYFRLFTQPYRQMYAARELASERLESRTSLLHILMVRVQFQLFPALQHTMTLSDDLRRCNRCVSGSLVIDRQIISKDIWSYSSLLYVFASLGARVWVTWPLVGWIQRIFYLAVLPFLNGTKDDDISSCAVSGSTHSIK